MTRITVNPADLADTAAVLHRTAGELQAVGTRVVACDCGCMPQDVAATVDQATAAARSRLQAISGALAEHASELAWRSGVPQTASLGATAVSSAWGGPAGSTAGETMLVGGGFDASTLGTAGGYSLVIGGSSLVDTQPSAGTQVIVGGTFDSLSSGSSAGYDFVVGGNFDIPSSGTGQGYDLVIGGNFDSLSSGQDQGYTFTVGSDFDLPTSGSTEGYNLVIGGDSSLSTGGDQGYSFSVGGNFDLQPSGTGEGYSFVIEGRPLPTGPSDNMGDNIAYLTGLAAQRGDAFTMGLLGNIMASQARTAEVWTLPAGWGYRYDPYYY